MSVGDQKQHMGIGRTAMVVAPILLVLTIVAFGVLWTSGQFTPRPGRARMIATSTTTPSSESIPVDHAHFQAGVALISYGCPTCIPYGPTDAAFAAGLVDMRQQTDAGWVEMDIDLYQDGIYGTNVTNQGPTTTPPDALANGVREAHKDGLHVFIVPHLKEGTSSALNWCGPAVLQSESAAQAWFASYWQALRPYLEVAQQEGVEQFALGNECNSGSPGLHIEQASPTLWQTLITEARSIYHHSLGYDMNWQGTSQWTTQPWMADPDLSFIGVSMYQPLVYEPQPLTLAQIAGVWRDTFLPELDGLSAACGNKPVILTEVGYWNDQYALYGSPDGTYGPYAPLPGPSDPQLQADAYQAAVSAALGDSHLDGIYFWNWGSGNFSSDKFAPNNLPAARVLHSLYGTVGGSARP